MEGLDIDTDFQYFFWPAYPFSSYIFPIWSSNILTLLIISVNLSALWKYFHHVIARYTVMMRWHWLGVIHISNWTLVFLLIVKSFSWVSESFISVPLKLNENHVFSSMKTLSIWIISKCKNKNLIFPHTPQLIWITLCLIWIVIPLTDLPTFNLLVLLFQHATDKVLKVFSPQLTNRHAHSFF